MQMVELSFDWDQWNVQKNETKHGISSLEAESAFHDPVIQIFDDMKHSDVEKRTIAYSHSAYGNLLTTVFTVRNEKIRIISCRRSSKKEREVYESANQGN